MSEYEKTKLLNPDDWLSVSQFSRKFELTTQCIRLAIAQGRIEAVKIGKVWIIPAREAKRFIPHTHPKRKKNATL